MQSVYAKKKFVKVIVSHGCFRFGTHQGEGLLPQQSTCKHHISILVCSDFPSAIPSTRHDCPILPITQPLRARSRRGSACSQNRSPVINQFYGLLSYPLFLLLE